MPYISYYMCNQVIEYPNMGWSAQHDLRSRSVILISLNHGYHLNFGGVNHHFTIMLHVIMCLSQTAQDLHFTALLRNVPPESSDPAGLTWSSLSHVLPCRYKQNHPPGPSAPDHPPRSFSAKRAAAGFQCPGHCRTRLQWASAFDMCWPQNKVKWNVIWIYVCIYNYTVVYIIEVYTCTWICI